MTYLSGRSNQGITPKGEFLDEFLGEAYHNDFLPPFDKFLEAVFGTVYIRCMIPKNNSHDLFVIDKKTCESRALVGQPSESSTPQPKQGLTNYEQEREANIARNTQLLIELGLDGGAKKLVTTAESSKKGKERLIEYYLIFFILYKLYLIFASDHLMLL